MVVAAAGFSRWIVLSGFEQVERRQVHTEVRHAQKLVSSGAEDLATRFEDWSAWDEPYAFVEDHNAHFIEASLRKEMLSTARIDAIAFVHRSGRVVYAVAHDRRTGENQPIPPELERQLVDIAGDPADERDKVRGLVVLPGGVMMVMANPLLTSERKGPCRGKLIIGRYLGDQEIGRLSEAARVGLQVRRLDETLPAEFRTVLQELHDGAPAVVREVDDDSIAGFGALRDLAGAQVALVRVELPRSIVRQGRSSTLSSTVAIALTATPFIILALVLLSRLERAKSAISQREQYYRTLIEGGSDLILILDEAHRVRYHSPAVAHALGCDAAEISGNELDTWVAPEERRAVHEILSRVEGAPGTTETGSFRWVRGDGQEVLVEAVFKNMALQPEVGGVLVNGRDVTERERTLRERKRLEDDLRQAQKLEAVGRLAGGIAHDFNNLLTVILGHADLLVRSGLSGAAAEGISALRAAATRAAALTQQLLSFSRKQVIAPRAVDINAAVERAREMLARMIGEDIRLEFRPGTSVWHACVDPNQFDQVLLNLAVNARDAMPSGGVLTIETRGMTVDEALVSRHPGLSPGDYSAVSVSDTGTGISSEDLPHIFEPFYTTKPVGKGTGLGLATVYGLVRQHGGVVLVDSEPGRGSTFRVLLPRTEPSGVSSRPPPRPTAGTHPGATVLLVEDDAGVQQVARAFLTDAGFRVTVASNPQQALDQTASAEPIDILVTDVVMPGMNGRELARRLRERYPQVRILYMSGYASTVLPKLPDLDPSEGFLQKPFQGDALVERVSSLLGQRSSRLDNPDALV